MATLLLTSGSTPFKQYHIKKGQTLTIGRQGNNDVTLESLCISAHHAKIDSVNDMYLITDLRSQNGTFVNDQPIASHWLRHGDIITIDKVTMVFTYDEGERRPAEEPPVVGQPAAPEAGRYRSMPPENLEQTAASGIQRETIGVLTFLSGGNGVAALTRKLSKIGRDPKCDVVVDGLLVGKTAATISNRPSGYFLSYVGGISKPKVNGRTIKKTVKLEEFDIIEIGSAKMQLVYQFV